jgi:hypothetical protein
MDQSRKRAREGEGDADAALRQRQQHADALADGRGAVGEDEPWQRPLGVFELPWLKCRSGLGVATGGWELRDVFFRSLVDGRAAAIGIPDDRLSPPPSKQTLFDDVEAWLAAAGDGEVDPVRPGGGPGPPRDAKTRTRWPRRALTWLPTRRRIDF